MILRFFYLWALAVLLASAPAPLFAQEPREAALLALRGLDQRVATIGHRLAVANRALCERRQSLPGIVLHDLSQYGADFRPAASRAFGLGAGPGILALVEEGPAARDGLRPDDILLTLDGEAVPHTAAEDRGFAAMERILDALDRAFADGEAVVGVRRDGAELRITVRGEEGCSSRFQLVPSRRLNAYADGRYVQVTTALGDYVADDLELAAVLAHEFAHNVLGHRARLDAAGVARGILASFGRNARLIRETEAEADRLSIHLLERAGFDPETAIRLWSRFGRRGFNIFGSPTHGGWRGRIAAMQEEVAAIREARAAGQSPRPPFVRLPAADGL